MYRDEAEARQEYQRIKGECESMLPNLLPEVPMPVVFSSLVHPLYDVALSVETCVCTQEVRVCEAQSQRVAVTRLGFSQSASACVFQPCGIRHDLC